MAKKPKYVIDLEDCGMGYEEYIGHVKVMSNAGVSVGPKRDRTGRYHGEFTWLAVPLAKDGPTYIACRTSPASAVEMLRDHKATIKSFGRELVEIAA